MASGHQTVVGAFQGTGADLKIETLGFKPGKVEIFNKTGLCSAVHVAGMAADSALKTVTAGTMSLITSNGITLTDLGFDLGADTDLNVDGEICHYVATPAGHI